MCGPVTVPTTFACTPKWPSASSSPGDLAPAGGVGRDLLGGGARQQPWLGQPPLEVRIVGRRRRGRAPWGVARSGDSARGCATRARARARRTISGSSWNSWVSRSIRELGPLDRRCLDVRRPHDQLAASGSGGRSARRGACAAFLAAARGGARGAREADAAAARITAGERAAGEQDHAGEQQEHGEDVRTGGADQARGRPQLRLAEDAAVRPEVGRGPEAGTRAVAGERERTGGEEQDRPGRNGLTRRAAPAQPQQHPPPASATGMPSRALPTAMRAPSPASRRRCRRPSARRARSRRARRARRARAEDVEVALMKLKLLPARFASARATSGALRLRAPLASWGPADCRHLGAHSTPRNVCLPIPGRRRRAFAFKAGVKIAGDRAPLP